MRPAARQQHAATMPIVLDMVGRGRSAQRH
jgi:hypothetical protein